MKNGSLDGGEQELVQHSPAMAELYRSMERVALSDLSVLLVGETGVGKDVMAQRIHALSGRRDNPLIPINCGSIPSGLVQSTLFGHERGAFTGAAQQHMGIFEAAHKGTVFLDELGEMSMEAQVALLRVLEKQQIIRVGGVRPVAVDVRIIAATNRELEVMVEEGTFRSDLYHRLDIVQYRIPPLRERREEIPWLSRYFAREASVRYGYPDIFLGDAALDCLKAYHWPGNVRELRNVIEWLVVTSECRHVQPSHLPAKLLRAVRSYEQDRLSEAEGLGRGVTLRGLMEKYEARLLVRALEQAGGNQTHAAELLDIPRRTLIYKMRKYNVGWHGSWRVGVN